MHLRTRGVAKNGAPIREITMRKSILRATAGRQALALLGAGVFAAAPAFAQDTPENAPSSETQPSASQQPAVATDPVAAADSDDALLYLTPIIGACQTIALHHMARLVTTLPEPAIYILNVPSFAQALGLSTAIGRNAKIVKVFGRLERFGFIRHSGTVEVRTTIPPLARRHVERMPEYLRATAPSV